MLGTQPTLRDWQQEPDRPSLEELQALADVLPAGLRLRDPIWLTYF